MHKSHSCLKPSLLDFRSRQRKISSFEDLICYKSITALRGQVKKQSNKHEKMSREVQAAFADHEMNIGCREPERSNLRAGGTRL